MADRGRPQPRGNHDRGGGRLPPDHRKGEVRRSPTISRHPGWRRRRNWRRRATRSGRFPGTRSGRPPRSPRSSARGPWDATFPFPSAVVLTEEIARLRYSLTADELVRYRWLGERVSAALESTVIATRAGGEGVGGRREALQRALEGPDRSHHADVGGRRTDFPFPSPHPHGEEGGTVPDGLRQRDGNGGSSSRSPVSSTSARSRRN